MGQEQADHLTRVQDAYDARAAEYVALLGRVDQAAAVDRELIAGWVAAIPGRVLDAGCGPGQWTDLLAADGREALGVDASGAFLESARTTYPGVPFVRGSLDALPLATGSCDGVLAWYSLIHTPPEGLPAVLDELARVLRPGGSLLLGCFDGEPGVPFDHAVTTAWTWSVESLEEMLRDVGLEPQKSNRRHDDGARPHADLVARAT